tara:strand:+ start:4595 stop:5014 length:420 start_codon:yes stop_codon:yes gene_type:complete
MNKIYSKIEPNKLLHFVHALTDSSEPRTDLVSEDNFIQCSFLKLEKNKTFKPHIHIEKERHYKKQIAQESWVVIKGKVQLFFYDIDGTLLRDDLILNAGDASFTLYGGHTYKILEEDTIVYEYKTGPYEGQKLDKRFLT